MDPYGIYNTRSANRVRAAKKRRKVQGVLWLFTVLGVMGLIVTAARVQRVASISSEWNLPLMARPAAAPVLANVNDGLLIIPTESGQLLAGKPAADTELRSILQTDFPLRAEPLIVANTVYVPCEDGALYAVGLRDARRLWRYQSDAAITSRPAYLEYSVTATTPIASNTPRPGATPTSPPSSPAATGTRQEVRKTIIAGNDQGLVSALDATNGRVRWRRRVPAPIGTGLTIARLSGRSLVLVPLLSGVASRGGLWCLDARTGAVVWKFPDEGKTFAAQLPAPVVAVQQGNGRVYTANDSGTIFSLDLKTGSKIGWQKAFVPPADKHGDAVLLRTEPLLEQYGSRTYLIVAANDGGVHCFDTADGKVVWSFAAPATVHCRPLSLQPEDTNLQRALILVGCDASNVYALDARSGALVRKLRTRGTATVGLVKVSDGVLAISSDGLIDKFTLR